MDLYKVLRKKWTVAAMAVFAAGTLQAQREMKTVNDSWEFRKPVELEWKMVNLPHTFNLDAYQRPDYYQGKGIYRRVLTLPEVDSRRRYYLIYGFCIRCYALCSKRKCHRDNGGQQP